MLELPFFLELHIPLRIDAQAQDSVASCSIIQNRSFTSIALAVTVAQMPFPFRRTVSGKGVEGISNAIIMAILKVARKISSGIKARQPRIF